MGKPGQPTSLLKGHLQMAPSPEEPPSLLETFKLSSSMIHRGSLLACGGRALACQYRYADAARALVLRGFCLVEHRQQVGMQHVSCMHRYIHAYTHAHTHTCTQQHRGDMPQQLMWRWGSHRLIATMILFMHAVQQ